MNLVQKLVTAVRGKKLERNASSNESLEPVAPALARQAVNVERGDAAARARDEAELERMKEIGRRALLEVQRYERSRAAR